MGQQHYKITEQTTDLYAFLFANLGVTPNTEQKNSTTI